MWAAQFYDFEKPARFSPARPGFDGIWLPGCARRQGGFPDKEVIDIDATDRSLMNVQELALAHVEGIAAKVMILNNQWLGDGMPMGRSVLYSNRGHTFPGHPKNTYKGSLEDATGIYPDYVKICEGFAVKCERVMHKKISVERWRGCRAKEPYVLDVHGAVHGTRSAMIPARGTYKDIISKVARPDTRIGPVSETGKRRAERGVCL